MTTETFTSPVGKILRMSLDTARPNKYKDNREEFYIQMLFDGTTTEGAAFKDAVAAVNNNVIVTKSDTIDIPTGHFVLRAATQYQPKVVDGDGTTADHIPGFPSGSTGTAIITVSPYKTKKGGGINLTGVALLTFEEGQYKESQTTVSLREALAKAKKG